MAQQDYFIDVRHGDKFPDGAVRAMDRGLQTSDYSCTESFVALWNKNGEPCFGRAHNNNGRIVAYFPWGGKEHASDNIGTFKVLMGQNAGFQYRWVPLSSADPGSIVSVGGHAPCVVRNVESGCGGLRRSEMLGKYNTRSRDAHTSWNGSEISHQGHQAKDSFVLCRQQLPQMPLANAPPSYTSVTYGMQNSGYPQQTAPYPAGYPQGAAQYPGYPQQNTTGYPGYPQQQPQTPGYPMGVQNPHQPVIQPTYTVPQYAAPTTNPQYPDMAGRAAAGERFMLKSKLNGKVVDVEAGKGAGSNVICYSINRPVSANQLWKLEPAGNGWFFIVSCSKKNLVLDVEGGERGAGSNVIVWDKKMPPSPNQLWRVQGGFVESALGQSLVLDIASADTRDGANIVVYTKKYQDNANQSWDTYYV